MTETDVIRIMRKHLERLFPKVCPNCDRCFATLRDYILVTKRIGPMMSYDAELGRWDTSQLMGTLALANCPCGTTVSLSTKGMELSTRKLLLDWIRCETQQRRLSSQELLEYLRDETRKQVLAESCQEDA